MPRFKLKKDLKNEIEISILMKDEEKAYWLSKLEVLPTDVMKSVYKAVKGKNDLTAKYLNAAFENDPGQKNLKKLKQKIKKIKFETLKIEEENQEIDADKFLDTEMGKL